MDIIFRASYGSNKDISVYKDLNLKPEQIYTVGKASKKQQGLATVSTFQSYLVTCTFLTSQPLRTVSR